VGVGMPEEGSLSSSPPQAVSTSEAVRTRAKKAAGRVASRVTATASSRSA
jgi:hypothetical protein